MGMTMKDGTVHRWLVAHGHSVRAGDPLFVLTTDKLEVEVEAETGGTVHHVVAEGTTLAPGGRIAWIVAPGEDVPAATATPATPSAIATSPAVSGGRVAATPVAKRRAAELGVDLADVAGSGPGGRITKEDVEAVAAHPAVAPTPGPRVPLTGMRGVIAERMSASLHEMAQLTLGYDVEMDAVVRLRKLLQADTERTGAVTPSYTDFVVKAVAVALRDHRGCNATINGDAIELLDDIHIGVAIALDHGLVVPVVTNADHRPLLDIATETRRLAQAARTNSLTLDEMSGASFSVTALGMHGIDFFTPIINPPNVAILGVGRVRDGVRFTKKGKPRPRREMTLSLTIDHRAIDGAPAAALLQDIGAALASPLHLLS
jgi:pyruvate dehydrogenase E2 component (dihydrolipoamide acetyltransferase)